MVKKKVVQKETTDCPDCGEEIALRGPFKIGQRIACPNCEADLEVVETVPLELDWQFEEDTDTEDEDS